MTVDRHPNAAALSDNAGRRFRMKLMSRTMIASMLALLALSAWGRPRVSFNVQEALKHIRVLAADGLQGRMSGEPGYQAAADYVVSKFKEWGLEPGGAAGSFLQDMTHVYEEPEKGALFQVISGPRSLAFHYDYEWVANNSSGSGTFVSEVVFVGYGLSEPQDGYDEYDGLDVRGKLVLACTDVPRELEEKLGRKVTTGDRVRAAQSHGARGIVLFRTGAPARELTRYLYQDLGQNVLRKDFVILNVQKTVVDFMFKHQPTELGFHLQQIQETLKPSSAALTVKAFVRLNMVRDEARRTMNILARIPGSAGRLRDEVVILGAHLDHLGMDMSGDVFNGADDNASGAAVVLEAARTMILNRVRPKRTIVFALWAAEETGLHGSEYYLEHPLYPLEKTAAYINLDMEGHGNGRVLFEGAYFAPELWDSVQRGIPRDVAAYFVPVRGGSGGSDHYPFMTGGVPTAFIDTDGYHFKTNRVGDVPALIQPDVLKNAGEAVTQTVEILALDEKLKRDGTLEARRVQYQWKARTVVNYEPLPLDSLIRDHREQTDPDVDVQLAVTEENIGSRDDGARLLRDLVVKKDLLKACPGLTPYESRPAYQHQYETALHPGRTAVFVGVRGLDRVKDDVAWAGVLSKQGFSFVLLERGDGLFAGGTLREKGAEVIKALGKARLLLVARGLTAAENRSLLQTCLQPVVIQTNDAPDPETLALVRKTRSNLGLILDRGEDPSAYFKRLDELARSLGREQISIVSEDDLWQERGRERMKSVIGEMLKAGFVDKDIAALIGGNFMSVFTRVRPE